MSSVRKFNPQVRLKLLVDQPGGIAAQDALARADAALGEIRDAGVVAIRNGIDALAACTCGHNGDWRHCYVIANDLYASAGALGYVELSAAAYNLCELLDIGKPESMEAAIAVHVAAMQALLSPDISASPAQRDAVVQELQQLMKKLRGGT